MLTYSQSKFFEKEILPLLAWSQKWTSVYVKCTHAEESVILCELFIMNSESVYKCTLYVYLSAKILFACFHFNLNTFFVFCWSFFKTLLCAVCYWVLVLIFFSLPLRLYIFMLFLMFFFFFFSEILLLFLHCTIFLTCEMISGREHVGKVIWFFS